jgi:hypothetical protein
VNIIIQLILLNVKGLVFVQNNELHNWFNFIVVHILETPALRHVYGLVP